MSDAGGQVGVINPIGGPGQPVIRAADYKGFYAANFRFRLTNLDAAITFVSIADFPGGQVVMQDEASATMSFSSMKLLSEHLAMAVQAIEQELGPIRVPAAIRPSEQNKALMIQAVKAMALAE
jgi:hypothetical protein